jgi:hypothetical protein
MSLYTTGPAVAGLRTGTERLSPSRETTDSTVTAASWMYCLLIPMGYGTVRKYSKKSLKTIRMTLCMMDIPETEMIMPYLEFL